MFRALQNRFAALVGIGMLASTIGLGLSILRSSEAVRASISVALAPLSPAAPDWQGGMDLCADCEDVQVPLSLQAMATAVLGLFLASPLFGVAALMLERARRRTPTARTTTFGYLARGLLAVQAGSLGAIALMLLLLVSYAGGIDSLEKLAVFSAMGLAYAAWGLPSILGIRAALVLLSQEQQQATLTTLRSSQVEGKVTQVGNDLHADRETRCS